MTSVPGFRPISRHSARRDVAWCLAWLVVVQLGLAMALERWRPELRDPEYGHKLALLRRQTAADPGRPLLLALGSSRTLNGLRPTALPPDGPAVFNFGLTRHGPVQQMLAFDRVLRDGARPRWVTIELLPSALPLGARELGPVLAGRCTWDDLRFLGRQAFRPDGYAAYWLEARVAPWYTSRFVVMSRYWPNWVPWAQRQDHVWTNTDPAGWLACPTPATAGARAAVRARAAAEYGQYLRHLTVDPDAARALRQTLCRCRAGGMGAALVLMPEAGWFRALLPPEGERLVRNLAADLGREFGVPLIDARDWCPDEEFLDGQHLLAAGAGRFTERFGHDVIPALVDGPATASRR